MPGERKASKSGRVYLVGAGPGDPELITLKGLACLQQAEVVVYDYLSNPELLSHAPPEAERIYVGKHAGAHALSQREINRLLVEKALEGRVVVRLKGGDPFLFGRGGEEAEELVAAGITFEIVPGVTSAIAVPAYAGVPLTHRAHTSSVTIITGHEDPSKEGTNLDWESLARGTGTLVILMGAAQLPQIARLLMDHGRDARTPVAVIRWGTTPEQQTVVGTLDEIARKVEEAGLAPPVVAVVGEVVGLRASLNWFETKPLFGRVVVVTRAREQVSQFARLLRQEGAKVLECPTITIRPPASWAELDNAIGRLSEFDWVIFTSVNGVRFFRERLSAAGADVRALRGIRLCAIGPATAEAVASMGLRADLVPERFQAEGVLDALAGETLDGVRFLLPRAASAREALPEGLRQRGAHVDVVAAYETVPPEGLPPEALECFEEGRVDLVTFSSSSTVSNFFKLAPREQIRQWLKSAKVAAIGPITAERAREEGLAVDIIPEEFTVPGLIRAIVEYYRGSRGGKG